jgi:hypothetical protein
VDSNSAKSSDDDSFEGKSKAQKKLVEELKVEWKLLWGERFNDNVRAEAVSVNNYTSLRVERGTIIHATRDYKALNFKQILEQHMVENPERFIQPDNNSGGWSKFVKTQINAPKAQKKRSMPDVPKKNVTQQPKKGGRGWLHTT